MMMMMMMMIKCPCSVLAYSVTLIFSFLAGEAKLLQLLHGPPEGFSTSGKNERIRTKLGRKKQRHKWKP